MGYFRLILCFFVALLALFIINGVFFAVIIFAKILKMILLAAIITFVYYLTMDDKKKDGEGV